MIPGTLLGALFLAACLVPGFVFLRYAEHRRAQLDRSSLLEAVELAGVGAATTLAATMIVLGAARWVDVIDTPAFIDDPGRYVLLHPFRSVGPLLVTFVLSSGLAHLLARAVFAKSESVFEPAGSAWARMIYDDRPTNDHHVILTVEMKDGRYLIGLVRTFTAELDGARELALTQPIGVAAGPGAPVIRLDDRDFMLIREEQIAHLAGTYVLPPADTAGEQRESAPGAPAAKT